jgi:hypothetical protein
MHCKACYFHETHDTTYQCELQQLVGKGLIRIIEHPTTIETRYYEHTSYRFDDPYIAKSVAPRIEPTRRLTDAPFVVIDLPMEPEFLAALPIHADLTQPMHCLIVIHNVAFH